MTLIYLTSKMYHDNIHNSPTFKGYDLINITLSNMDFKLEYE